MRANFRPRMGRVCGDFCEEHHGELDGDRPGQVGPQIETIFGREWADLRLSLWQFL